MSRPRKQSHFSYVVRGEASAGKASGKAEQERITREVERFLDLPVWRLRQYPVKYGKRQGPRARKRRYWCPPGCYPAYLASRYDDLPWSHFISLSEAPGKFWSSWEAWRGIEAWEDLTDRLEYQAFWILVLAKQKSGAPHVHILVGNVPSADVEREVARWPGSRDVRKVHHRWGILHYCFAGTRDPREHARDVFSYCPALIAPPFESDNLDLLYQLTRQRILRTASRRATRGRTASWRRARATLGASARWAPRGRAILTFACAQHALKTGRLCLA